MQTSLSSLPQIDLILKDDFFKNYNTNILKKIAQEVLGTLRKQFLNQEIKSLPNTQAIFLQIQNKYLEITTPSFKPLINATGVVLQTNLGRSIFSSHIIEKTIPLLKEYNNLEYNIQEGIRGERYTHLKNIICTLFDCEDAIVVNNNAAAVMLIINTFAKNKEVVISRGELVEIGGSFRIPEVIKESGANLIEVGATNKTHLKDYQEAITENTSMLLKVHQSNFAQIGFVQQVEFKELQDLAKKHNLIDYFDVGSGYIKGIECDEPSLLEIAKNKPSLVSFSGDKLLGGPQAGIIFGKKHLIEKLKKNHLLRALRIDKFNLILLQETLLAYLNDTLEHIPTINMLNQTQEELLQKATELKNILGDIKEIQTQILPVTSKAGGGSLPYLDFDSYGVSIQHYLYSAQNLGKKLRIQGLITRTKNESIILDVRCLEKEHFKKIHFILSNI